MAYDTPFLEFRSNFIMCILHSTIFIRYERELELEKRCSLYSQFMTFFTFKVLFLLIRRTYLKISFGTKKGQKEILFFLLQNKLLEESLVYFSNQCSTTRWSVPCLDDTKVYYKQRFKIVNKAVLLFFRMGNSQQNNNPLWKYDLVEIIRIIKPYFLLVKSIDRLSILSNKK